MGIERRLGPMLLALAAVAVGCDSGGVTLLVDVRSDLRAGAEVTHARVEVVGGAAVTVSLASADLLAGHRVAELGLTPGSAELEVALLRGSEVVVTRRVIVEVHAGTQVLVVVLSRSCAAIECASGQTCVAGECVSPTCVGEGPAEGCPDACSAERPCPAAGGCLHAQCTLGVCLQGLDDSRCEAGAICQAGGECAAVDPDGGALDAGVPDGGAHEVHVVDVVVAGAGPGGIGAAIQASRMGRSVVLLEETTHVGGQLLSVPNMDEGRSPTSTMGEPVRQNGLYGELAARMVARYGARPLGTCLMSHVSFCFEPRTTEEELRAWLVEEGVTLATGARVSAVSQSGGRVTGVVMEDGTRYEASVVIDATEYGDLMPLAGVAYRVGNGRRDPRDGSVPDLEGCVQDITYPIAIREHASFAAMAPGLDLRARGGEGADYAIQREHFVANVIPGGGTTLSWTRPWRFGVHNAYRGVPDRDGPFYRAFDHTDDARDEFPAITKTMINLANDYPGEHLAPGYSVAAIEDRAVRAREECRARFRTIQFMIYMQRAAPEGLGEPWAPWDEVSPFGFAPECDEALVPAAYASASRLFPATAYVREGRRMIGVDTLTIDEIRREPSSRHAPYPNVARTDSHESLAIGTYAVDLHNCSDASELESELGDTPADLGGPAGPFQVPFGTFVPRDVDGFLVAEKNLSASRLVNGAIRLQPIAFQTGQAAGVIAALAIARDEPPREVPPVLVQRALVDAGAMIALDGFPDVPRGHARWADVQLVGTHQILTGRADGTFGVTEPLTRAQAALTLQRLFDWHVSDPPDWTPLVGFADVSSASLFYPYIEALAREGITNGCGTDTSGQPLYCPNDGLRRAQLAAFLIAALGVTTTACASPPFPDVMTSHPLCPQIQELDRLGLAVPCAGGGFCPADSITRGDMARTLALVLAHLAEGTSAVGACYRTPPDYCP